MQKLLFIDRDGTMVGEPQGYELAAFERLEFYPFVFRYLGKIADELDYKFIMVSNQDGLGSPTFTEENFFRVHDFILKCFANEGINFEEILIDRTFPAEKALTRKPNTGMLAKYLNNPEYDLENSFVIGDRITDVQLARNLNCKAIWLNNNSGLGSSEITDTIDVLRGWVVLETEDWKDVYEFLSRES